MVTLVRGLQLLAAGVFITVAQPAMAQYYQPEYGRSPQRVEMDRLRYGCDRGDRRACYRLREMIDYQRYRRWERHNEY